MPLGHMNPKRPTTLRSKAGVELVVGFTFRYPRHDRPRHATFLQVALVLLKDLLARVDTKITSQEARRFQGRPCLFGHSSIRKDGRQETPVG